MVKWLNKLIRLNILNESEESDEFKNTVKEYEDRIGNLSKEMNEFLESKNNENQFDNADYYLKEFDEEDYHTLPTITELNERFEIIQVQIKELENQFKKTKNLEEKENILLKIRDLGEQIKL